MKISKNQIFQRQTTLQEVGEQGQQKLQDAKVAVVGCGGLGSVAAVYLAASGIGKLQLIDFDVVDVSNLHRQVFYSVDVVGKSKADVLANHINEMSPFVEVRVSNIAITKNNIAESLSDWDIVLDCTDLLPIKYLLNDFCVLSNKTLVYGSLYKFDGYVATFNLNGETSNLRDAFPEIPTENIPNCSALGTLNSIVGIIGLMQANEVLKIVTGVGSPLVNELLIYNSLDNSQFKMKLKPSFSKDTITELFQKETYEEVSCEINDELEISSVDFKNILESGEDVFEIVSVIENTSQDLPFKVDVKTPLSDLEDWISEDFDENKKYIFICNRGISSMIAATQIKEEFPNTEVLSLAGGISEF
ncbi:MAG: molybdopterin biosynthesis protein MoeB [Bacteroidetes bacterium MedPE-SWsnd-G1]|nr:MAG: molybdopterin biosynthesis protein MoeB [Bacteroidetes bacterium MedPE-SWsnd-G1]